MHHDTLPWVEWILKLLLPEILLLIFYGISSLFLLSYSPFKFLPNFGPARSIVLYWIYANCAFHSNFLVGNFLQNLLPINLCQKLWVWTKSIFIWTENFITVVYGTEIPVTIKRENRFPSLVMAPWLNWGSLNGFNKP